MKARMRLIVVLGTLCGALGASAQVPDLLNALDAGGRAMGIGGATNATDSTTLSSYYNPAGLAFVTGPLFGIAFRNLPQSTNTLTGSFHDPDFSTERETGSRRLTHAGFAIPMRGGVWGLSYTMGGYFKDFRTATNLSNGQTSVQNLVETVQAQTDFFTLAWGKSAGDMNYGLGLVFANQYIADIGSYDIFDANNNFAGTVRINNSGNTHGFGVIGGLQFYSGQDRRTLVGLSVRSPISLSSNSQTGPYMNKVPGRASLGIATRRDNLRGGPDFLVYGAQADYYFGADKNGSFARKDVAGGGVGFEYNAHRFGGRVPVRLGYQFVPSGGDRFINRNTFTFGLGYRPSSGRLAADLNFGLPAGGGNYDMALSLTYRIGD